MPGGLRDMLNKLNIAANYARNIQAETHCTEREACLMALVAFPELKVTADQLKGKAFGVTWFGFGKPVK